MEDDYEMQRYLPVAESTGTTLMQEHVPVEDTGRGAWDTARLMAGVIPGPVGVAAGLADVGTDIYDIATDQGSYKDLAIDAALLPLSALGIKGITKAKEAITAGRDMAKMANSAKEAVAEAEAAKRAYDYAQKKIAAVTSEAFNRGADYVGLGSKAPKMDAFRQVLADAEYKRLMKEAADKGIPINVNLAEKVDLLSKLTADNQLRAMSKNAGMVGFSDMPHGQFGTLNRYDLSPSAYGAVTDIGMVPSGQRMIDQARRVQDVAPIYMDQANEFTRGAEALGAQRSMAAREAGAAIGGQTMGAFGRYMPDQSEEY